MQGVGHNKKMKYILVLMERNSFFAREFLRGALAVRFDGWEFLCMPPTLKSQELREYCANHQIDGVIARGLGEDVSQCVKSLGVPSVLIRGSEASFVDFINGPQVDDGAIGRLAGEEFQMLNLGYWGFVHWDGVGWSEARRASFHSYATAHGMSNDTLKLAPESRANWKGITEIAAWLEGLPKPCGVLACNDEAGVDVLHACRMMNYYVPGDVAVIGVDNDRLLCESSAPALTSIDLKAGEVGRAAVMQLSQMLGGELEARSSSGAARLVVRSSSHEVDRYRLVYQKAMDYIESRPMENTGVDELARFTGVSRRGLERAFEKYTKRSPALVMRERRMDEILELLKMSSSSLESIAIQAGFSDTAGFSNFVKRMTGSSPGGLRNKPSSN